MSSYGIKYDSQKRMGRWCFDYFIPEANLVVEIDGAYWHSSDKVKDRDRRKEAWLEQEGIGILRIDADAVSVDIHSAMAPVLRVALSQTGQEAVLESNGKTFAQIKAERTGASAEEGRDTAREDGQAEEAAPAARAKAKAPRPSPAQAPARRQNAKNA